MPSSGVVLTAVSLFACGFFAGFLMHRSDFCMAGAFRDLFLFRSTVMLRPLLLLVALAGLLFELERQAGWIRVPFPLFRPPTPYGLLGGILFGFGMVLAGGCVVGVLYKVGSGSRAALSALGGLIVGSAAYAELHGALNVALGRQALTDAVTLPQLTGIAPAWWVALLVVTALLLTRRWAAAGLLNRPAMVEAYVQPWQAALLLALLVAIGAAVSGLPFGIATSYLKLAAMFEQLVAPAHVASLPLFSASPVQLRLPVVAATLRGGSGPGFDLFALLQYPLIGGIVAGAASSALRLREWSWKGRLPARQALGAFAGGVVMVFGARLASGCNIWHLWGGLPIFSLQSLLFLGGLLPGAWIGSLAVSRIILGKGVTG